MPKYFQLDMTMLKPATAVDYKIPQEVFIRFRETIVRAFATDARLKLQKVTQTDDKVIIEEQDKIPVMGKYVQNVKAHNRKGTKRVRAHKRVYKNYKPVKLPKSIGSGASPWRMVRWDFPQLPGQEKIDFTKEENVEKFIVDAIVQEFGGQIR